MDLTVIRMLRDQAELVPYGPVLARLALDSGWTSITAPGESGLRVDYARMLDHTWEPSQSYYPTMMASIPYDFETVKRWSQ